MEDPEINEYHSSNSNSTLRNTRCCCFPSTVRFSWWHRIKSTNGGHHSIEVEDNPKWWSKGVKALKKIREWSEIIAGPKWKTFIRRFSKTCRGGGSSNNNRHHHGKFQYDPLSYALNFDEGQNGHLEEDYYDDDYGGFRDFSSRFTSSGKPVGMGVDSKDAAAAVVNA